MMADRIELIALRVCSAGEAGMARPVTAGIVADETARRRRVGVVGAARIVDLGSKKVRGSKVWRR